MCGIIFRRFGFSLFPDAMDGPKETANDAIMSKVSASSLGYYSDDFSAKLASEFLAPYGAPPRRVPMMNRGTWARVAAMDRVVDEFLSMPFPPCHGTPPKRQIVSLGAGFDSRFFLFINSYKSEPSQLTPGPAPTPSANLCMDELDRVVQGHRQAERRTVRCHVRDRAHLPQLR